MSCNYLLLTEFEGHTVIGCTVRTYFSEVTSPVAKQPSFTVHHSTFMGGFYDLSIFESKSPSQ